MTAQDILKAAAGHMKDRETVYDSPGGERSIPAVVTAFNAITGHTLTAEQGWLFQLLVKAVRSQQGEYRADTYEDAAAYAALQGEQAAQDRTNPEAQRPCTKTSASPENTASSDKVSRIQTLIDRWLPILIAAAKFARPRLWF